MSTSHFQSTSPVLWRLVIHFSILSIIAAYLIGMGKHSSNLPLLVCVMAILALVNSDWLGWLRISRAVSYFGMLAGTALALYGYWNDRQSNQYYGISNLYAVANMLVYIQIPLMFQRKDIRLFEHWGVFLMLEFVVAALLNDNVLFGLFLVPSLFVSCATMLALATYTSHEYAGKDGPEAPGFWHQLLNGLPWNRRQQSKATGIRMSTFAESNSVISGNRSLGMIWGVVLGAGTVFFAIAYFFVLPRLHTGAYEGLGFTRPLVGFSGRISLEDFGELMASDDLALRMSIQELAGKRPFEPLEPPYIRGTIVDIYDGQGNWTSSEENTAIIDVPLPNQIRDELRMGGNTHIVTIQEQTQLGVTQFSIPPFFRGESSSPLKFNASSWCLHDNSYVEKQIKTKQRYQFESSAYQLSQQIPYLIEYQDCVFPSSTDSAARPSIKPRTWNEAVSPKRFEGLLALRDEILASAPTAIPMEKALLLEDYLASSGAFAYSLLPKVNRRNGLDPIEDFAANHRTGHCQYFASTLAIMLRSLGLPARIVIGFRPSEYNDVGGYFVVRQRHAHAWVEVHLDVDEIQNETLKIPEWARGGIWLRLDPTPPGEGSNAGGSLRNASRSGQTLEAIEQLWKDGFMDFDSTRQPDAIGLFGVSGDGMFALAIRSIERLLLQLQSRAFGGGELSTENWFSWRSGLLASSTAILGLLAFRMLNRFAWRLDSNWSRKGYGQRLYRTPSWSLFQRMMKALARVGLHRPPHQTPLEFVKAAQTWLDQNHFSMPSQGAGLRSLVEAYYALRYGSGRELSQGEWNSLDATVKHLEIFSIQHRSRFHKRSFTSSSTAN